MPVNIDSLMRDIEWNDKGFIFINYNTDSRESLNSLHILLGDVYTNEDSNGYLIVPLTYSVHTNQSLIAYNTISERFLREQEIRPNASNFQREISKLANNPSSGFPKDEIAKEYYLPVLLTFPPTNLGEISTAITNVVQIILKPDNNLNQHTNRPDLYSRRINTYNLTDLKI